mmetsp:Transcript_75524/g.221452  ORF Transcript_75524/g.221452 Transcript_75524/m.221452 type:complete len:240 (-) Transcript_75524:335-1054(-)
MQQTSLGSQSSVHCRLDQHHQAANITWTAEQGHHSTLLPTLGCHHLPELFHLLLLLFLVLLTHCTRTEATHPSGLCLLIHLKGLLIQPLVMLVNIGWESKLPKIDIRLQKFNALMGMEPIPEIIRGNRPQEKPENAGAPGRMNDVQRLEVLGILCVQAIPELSRGVGPHARITELHPDHSEWVIRCDNILMHLGYRKGQKLPHVDPDVMLTFRSPRRQNKDAPTMFGLAVAPPCQLLVP